MSPKEGEGYWVYTLEKWSFVRRDTWMLVKYATAAVNCVMPGSGALAMIDGSQSDGTVPKSSTGSYRHPPGSHVYGMDLDIGYYQTGATTGTKIAVKEVCPHKDSLGQDLNHCVSAPDILDVRRSAYLVAKLAETGRFRVAGVDGKIGPLLKTEAAKLHSEKLITTRAYNMMKLRTAYEITNTGQGWYFSHHHHIHLSTNLTYYPPSGQSSMEAPPNHPDVPFTPLPSYTLPSYDLQLPEIRAQVLGR
jgi:hypothetical protein